MHPESTKYCYKASKEFRTTSLTVWIKRRSSSLLRLENVNYRCLKTTKIFGCSKGMKWSFLRDVSNGAGRFSATVEVAGHDLARQINMSIPKVSNTVDIVVSVLIPRAQEESGAEKVYADVKLSPFIHNTGRPTKEVLSVQLEKRVKRRCPQSCACSCHPIRDLNSPNALVPLLGKAFLRYCRIAQSTGPCNISRCENQIPKYARFTYIFPPWMMSRLVSVTFMGDPLMVVRSLRLVPTHSDSLRLCSINEVERFRLLFEKKVASPFDASAWDGRSLLHVRYPKY
jgi:hypothetical protein